MKQAMLGEFGIGVGRPIHHLDEVIEVVVMRGRNVLDQQIPRHRAAFDQRLIHREDVGIHLRLVGDQRSGGMQNAGIDLPSGAGFQLIGTRKI